MTAGLVVGWSNLWACPASAQELADRDTGVLELSPIEVLVSIAPTAAPSIGSGMPARISTVSRAEIERWNPRLPTDILATQAGVSLYDDLGSFYKLNVSSRGFTAGPTVGLPPGVSVFVDGVRQNEPAAQEVNFDLLPMEHVERIEILRGNASLLGPNSLGGAVNLITRGGGGPLEGDVELSGGSFGMWGAGGNVSGELPSAMSYFAGGGYEEEDGWREGTRGRRYHGMLNLGRSEGQTGFRVQALWSDSRGETAGSLPESIFHADPRVNFTAGDFEALALQQLTLSGYRPILDGSGSATVYLRRSDGERFNVNQPPEGDVRSLAESATLGGTGQWRRRLPLDGPVVSVRAGVDAAASWSRVRIFEEEPDGPDRELTTDVESPRVDLAAFVMGDLELGRAVVSAGARLDYMRVPFDDLLDPSADTTNTFARLSPRVGASLGLGSSGRVYGSVGLSFRAPAILELACSDPEDACPLPFALGDDPPLDPVRATSYELGAGWRLGAMDLASSLYRIDVTDEIFFVPSEESVVEGFFRNLGRTRREGIEIEAAGMVESLSLYANYAYTRAVFRGTEVIFSARADDESEGSELAGENRTEPGDRLPMVPAHQAKLGGAWSHPSGVTAGLDARFFGQQWFRGDEANEVEPLDGRFVVNGRAGVGLGSWEILGLVYNLLDTDRAVFGTFNINQGTDELERFLTPSSTRSVRIVVRRSFGEG